MRLTTSEIKAIKKHCRNIFGNDSEVRLFGSRTDDLRRGGDIDLFISTKKNIRVMDIIRFNTKLKLEIGDQKIDTLVSSPNRKHREIYDIAKNEGVLL